MSKNLQFEPMYPDVLGAIAGGLRITYGNVLQAALGIFPRSAYLNQPFEVILILQSMTDQNMEVRVALNLPSRNPDGGSIKLHAPQKDVSRTMTPGEVGVMRLPLVALPPTQPANDIPIRVTVRHRSRPGKQIRSVVRGAPPSALAASPFKLQALRDVDWVDADNNVSPPYVTLPFDINARELPRLKERLKPSYEVLWTQEKMRDERLNILSKIDEARHMAATFTRAAVYNSLLTAVDERYAMRGLPLHPGETAAIAKMLMYTLDDRSQLDPKYRMEEQGWFQALCQVLAHDPQIAEDMPGEIVGRHLLDPLISDAIFVGFNLIRSRVKVDLGSDEERANYANRMMRWLSGQDEPDLVYIYLPLALGGVIVNHQVTGPGDDPWEVIDGVREAYRGRVRLVEGDAMEIFEILDKLLARGVDELRRLRIPR
ncbi:MAG: hypothetical protein IT319_12570 [Anaerolineae bacterium]|nr:hypothetical protein [Anaerolineae bacterium]